MHIQLTRIVASFVNAQAPLHLSLFTGPLFRRGRFRFGRTQTRAPFVPTGDLPKAAIIAEFDRLQAEQITIVREADGLPIDRVKIVSPFEERMRYNAYSALVILPRHQHRHLDQAEQLWTR